MIFSKCNFSFDSKSPQSNNFENLKLFLSNYKYVISVEEHNIIGGIGTMLSEAITEPNEYSFKRLGMNDEFTSVVGDQNYLRGLWFNATKSWQLLKHYANLNKDYKKIIKRITLL